MHLNQYLQIFAEKEGRAKAQNSKRQSKMIVKSRTTMSKRTIAVIFSPSKKGIVFARHQKVKKYLSLPLSLPAC